MEIFNNPLPECVSVQNFYFLWTCISTSPIFQFKALIRKWVLRSLKEIYLHTNAHICSTNGLCYGLLNKDVKWSIFREYGRVFSVWTNHTFASWQRDRHSKVAGQTLSRTREGRERTEDYESSRIGNCSSTESRRASSQWWFGSQWPTWSTHESDRFIFIPLNFILKID